MDKQDTDTTIEEPNIIDIAAAAYDAVESGEIVPEAAPIGVDELDEALGKTDEGTDKSAAPADTSEPPVDAPATDGQDAPDGEDGQADPTQNAPSSWNRDVAAKWADLPPEVRAEIHRRETDMHNGVAQLRQQASLAQEVQQVVAPYMHNFQAAGVHPMQAINHLLGVEHTLRNGSPQEKAYKLAEIARDYGVDLQAVAPLPQLDPQVQAIIAQNRKLQQFQQTTLQQQQQAVHSEIDAFRANPANVHFEAVKDDMSTLLQAGKADSLQDAYDKAIWMRSDIRQTLLNQQRTEAQQQATTQQRKARAQTAAGGVKGVATAKSAIDANTDIREVARMAYDGEI